jgi:hypothetical protein
MSVFVGVLTLVSLSLNKVIHLQYRGRRRGEPYKWSISLRRTERGKERAEHESRAEPSQSEKLKHSKEIFENITPPFENKSLSLDAYLVCDL